jgi:hypothetical protein
VPSVQAWLELDRDAAGLLRHSRCRTTPNAATERHCCVVALRIGIDKTTYPMAVEEASTENATLVRHVLVGLRERGLDVTRPVLALIDGAKASRSAVLEVFEHRDHPEMPTTQDQKRRGQAAR